MYCVKCNTFERLWEAIMTSTMIPLLYTHIKLRGYAFKCAKYGAHGAHFLHTHAQSLRTQQWLIVDVIIASIVYRDRWWGGTLLCIVQSALTSGVATLSINTLWYSPTVFGDAALINYANLCIFSQNHIKCSYFLISWQIFFLFGIQIYYR